MAGKWEKVEFSFTDEERRSFRNALIIFAIIEALVLIPVLLLRIIR
jgi:predicted nucleic acid-binding Zn ribbon protein